MKKLIIWVLIVLIVAGFIAFKARNVIVKSILENGTKSLTNLKLTLEKVDVDIAKHSIAANNLKLYNPPGFEKTVMLNIPFVYIDYNPAAAIQRKVHFYSLKIDLKELLIVRNRKGNLNFMAIKAIKGGKFSEKRKNFKIDRLYLSIGKVVCRDYYKKKSPATYIYNINLKDQLFENVDNPKALVSAVMHKALAQTNIYQLFNFNMNVLRRNLKDVIDKGGVVIKEFTSNISETVKDATKDVERTLKDIFTK